MSKGKAVVHYVGRTDNYLAAKALCRDFWFWITDSRITMNRNKVTCENCRRRKAFKDKQ